MKILAVETSGLSGSVAIAENGHVLQQRVLCAEGRRHAQTLVSEAREVLNSHRLRPSDIDAVAVSIGPGSFTGLRVGVVFAKTFAWANQARLIAIDTLQAAAQQCDSAIPFVTVISDAQRGEVFVNRYRCRSAEDIRMPVGEILILNVDELATVAQGTDPEVVTGPGLEKFVDRFPPPWQPAPQTDWTPRAATIAVLGTHAAHEQRFADPETLEPLYLRRSYAEEKRPG
ncbi:MAG: tRNA (adenosine(37)-N6)-threonylcarbamoyltransferase complex dimerization subunit type 1 TsaB [Planctomycetaceae bacterium]